jgi:heptose-I-phosphate ethanolaminephosphotransferase
MIRNKPLFVALLFTLFPLGFYLIDFINYSRAGKIAITGMATIGLLTALSKKYTTIHFIRYLLIFMSFVFFANLSFQAGMRDIFGVAQDEMMIMKAIFGTDMQESYEFWLQYKPYLIKHLLLLLFSFGIFYFFALRATTKYQNIHIGKAALISWVLFFTMGHLEKSIRRGNPIVYFPHFYMEWKSELRQLNALNILLQKNINNDMLSDTKYLGKEKKNTLVWVIGESSTKYNWSLYGYERKTTPFMDSIKDELLVFQNIRAAAPITVPAFERMFTPATIRKPDLWKSEPSVIQIAKKAGYHTYWISNHTTDAHNGITYVFSHQADETYMTNRGKARGEGSYDASVLPAYEKALADPYDKKLILVHLLGSHPAYNFRYPEEYARFTGIFNDKVAKELSNRGVADWAISFRNFYDNSVFYGDYIRYTLLKLLQGSKEANHAAWLYHPDHGEDVCHHDNFSGHNQNVKEQWEIPMIFWSQKKRTIDTTKTYQLDTIESMILGLLKVESNYYNPKYDLFKK